MASASTNPAGAGSAMATARMLVITNYDIVTKTLTGRLPDGTVLSPETVRRLACDAEILPAVFGSDSQLLNLGMSARTASTGQRAALAERDGGCRGCGAGVEFCAAHHIIHWAAQGPTDLDNLVLLCSRCHHLVHEGGYTVHKRPDSKYIIIAPKQTERPQPHTGHANRSPGSGGTGDRAHSHANNTNRTPSSNATNQSNRTSNTNGTPCPHGTSNADRTPGTNSAPSARGTPNTNTSRSPGPSETGQPNRTPGTGRPGHPNTTPGANGACQSDGADQSVRAFEDDTGQTNCKKRNKIVDQCLTEARKAIADADPPLDLFGYAR